MKFGNLESLFGDDSVLTKETDVVFANIAPIESLSNTNSRGNSGRFHNTIFTALFRKQKPQDPRHRSCQPTDIRAVEASLKRGEKKIDQLEAQINKLASDKRKLYCQVSDQSKIIKNLTKINADQTKEISKLNKTILSQKDLIEEFGTKGDATQSILQWYNQTNDNLCKRLVETNNELQQMKKFVDQNI